MHNTPKWIVGHSLPKVVHNNDIKCVPLYLMNTLTSIAATTPRLAKGEVFVIWNPAAPVLSSKTVEKTGSTESLNFCCQLLRITNTVIHIIIFLPVYVSSNE